MTDLDASQASPALLPQRPKMSGHQTPMGSARHRRRAHTAPHYREGSLTSTSTSLTSLNSCGSGETIRSSRKGQRPSSRPYACHISCRVSPDRPGHFEYLRPYSVFRPPLKRARSVPLSFSDSYQLQHPDLNKGQKTYLWHTAAVYSVSNMKSLQERRYKQMLQHQVDIGFHTQEECDRYLRYLLGTRKRQYTADPSVWRNPPKIPVRPKSFHLPPPVKSQSPRGYKDSQRGQGDDEEGNAESGGEEQLEGQGEDRGQTEEKGQTEGEDPTEATGQTDKGKGQTEDIDQDDSNDEANDDMKDSSKQNEDSHADSDEDQNLSESMQGVSLYYDPQRKTTITRGQPKNDGDTAKENAEGEGSQKSPANKISHQNCFWGSH